MARIELTAEESAFIAARITAWEIEHTEGANPSNPFGSDALLIYGDVGGVIGIRPDGELFTIPHGEPVTTATPLDDPFWVRVVLGVLTERYPQLRHHVPKPPAGATPCGTCQGTGTMARYPNLICYCGGVGWIDEHTPK